MVRVRWMDGLIFVMPYKTKHYLRLYLITLIVDRIMLLPTGCIDAVPKMTTIAAVGVVLIHEHFPWFKYTYDA